jgi:hypothetical protein
MFTIAGMTVVKTGANEGSCGGGFVAYAEVTLIERSIAPRSVSTMVETKPKEIGEMGCGRISPF